MKSITAILLMLLLTSCTIPKEKDAGVEQPMTCEDAAYKIYAELTDSEKSKLEAITTLQALQSNQNSRNRIYIDSPYYRYPGVNESCAAIAGKKKVHFEILPFILTEWVWTITRKSM